MKIVTHNAKFHSDDVFGVASLLILHPDAEIIRTRDQDIIKLADSVLDVGEIDDPSINRFDHHQFGGAGKRTNGIPYASFGLIWRKFGKEITGSEELAERIDRMVVQPIDAADNAQDLVETKFDGIFPLAINSVVNSYRPTWKEEAHWDQSFTECVTWAKSFLERTIKIEKDVLEGEKIVQDAYNNAANKALITVSKDYDLGRELVTSVLLQYPEPLYAILYRQDHGNWQVVAVRKNSSSFALRKPLPDAWRAKHLVEFENISGVKGAQFCHRNGFMCTIDSEEGALKLAEIALNA